MLPAPNPPDSFTSGFGCIAGLTLGMPVLRSMPVDQFCFSASIQTLVAKRRLPVLVLSPEAGLDRRLRHSKFGMRLFPQARMPNRRTMLLEWPRLAMTGSRAAGTWYLT